MPFYCPNNGEYLKHIALAPNGGYVILSGRNSFVSNAVSDELYKSLAKFKEANEEIKKVNLGPDGSFVVLRGQYGFWKQGVSSEVSDKLWAIYNAKGVLSDVVLTDNGYVINSGGNDIQYKAISDNLVKNLTEISTSVTPSTTNEPTPMSDECEWRERELTITIFGNDELYLNADARAFTCDSKGKPARNGWYVIIHNSGKEDIYYGAASIYGDRASNSFFKGTCINFNPYPIPPKSFKIIRVIEAKSKEEENLMTYGVLRIKYCKPKNKPTADDYASLPKFKEALAAYNVVTTDNQSTQQTAPVGNQNGSASADCKYYYLAVVSLEYVSSRTIQIIFSNIHKGSLFIDTKTDDDAGKFYCLPQCDFNVNIGAEFTSQSLIKDLRLDKTFGTLTITVVNLKNAGNRFLRTAFSLA